MQKRQNGYLRSPYKGREVKGNEERKVIPTLMQSSKEQQGDKKAFLSDNCKEIEENNRMVKTRELFRKILQTMGTFHAKMGSIKGRNGMDLTETEDIT